MADIYSTDWLYSEDTDYYSASDNYYSGFGGSFDTSSLPQIDTTTSVDMFDQVMEVVESAGSWIEDHPTVARLGTGIASGLMSWSQNDIMQDQYDQNMQLAYDQMDLSKEQKDKQLEISKQLADAASLNAYANKLLAEGKEDQRKIHNTGISNYGSKYGK